MCLKGSLKEDSSSILVMDIEDDHEDGRERKHLRLFVVGGIITCNFVEIEMSRYIQSLRYDYFNRKRKVRKERFHNNLIDPPIRMNRVSQSI